MALDPSLQSLFAAVPFEHVADVGIERFRSLYLERAARAPSSIDLADIQDRTIGDDLGIRIYRPKDHQAGSAIVLHLHGGGWAVGNLDTHDHIAREIAVQTSAVVVSVDYRLAPEHPYPAAVEDAWLALQWVSEHAVSLGADPRRLAVAGDSAGGNLCAVLTQLARDNGGPAISFQLLWYPATTLEPGLASMTQNAEAPILSRADMAFFQRCYADDAVWASGPATLLPGAAADLTDLPPAYIATAQYDPLRDDGARYAQLLQDNGNSVELVNHPELTHGFVGYGTWVPSAAAALAQSLTAMKAGLTLP
jgi:acetyl esterase